MRLQVQLNARCSQLYLRMSISGQLEKRSEQKRRPSARVSGLPRFDGRISRRDFYKLKASLHNGGQYVQRQQDPIYSLQEITSHFSLIFQSILKP
jgi:hypothetical protein